MTRPLVMIGVTLITLGVVLVVRNRHVDPVRPVPATSWTAPRRRRTPKRPRWQQWPRVSGVLILCFGSEAVRRLPWLGRRGPPPSAPPGHLGQVVALAARAGPGQRPRAGPLRQSRAGPRAGPRTGPALGTGPPPLPHRYSSSAAARRGTNAGAATASVVTARYAWMRHRLRRETKPASTNRSSRYPSSHSNDASWK
jgi:hypothetical protein